MTEYLATNYLLIYEFELLRRRDETVLHWPGAILQTPLDFPFQTPHTL